MFRQEESQASMVAQMKSTTPRIAALSLTLRQASEVTGLSVRKLYELIGEGKLASVTVGRRRLVIAKSLEELIAKET
jgi:excisionase family DNA binding protein